MPNQQPYEPGQRVFGHYVLKRLVGQGRGGMVWEAEDERLQRRVAIKFLQVPTHQLADKLPLLLELQHPNIVGVYDLQEEGDTVGLITEWVDGESLATVLRKHKKGFFEVEEIQGWVAGLMSGLHHAESRGKLVHGAITLDHLWVTSGGELKVSEYGFTPLPTGVPLWQGSQAEVESSFVTLSPQVLGGGACRLTDDLYAVAACVYQLLTGVALFSGENLVSQIQRKVPLSVAAKRVELGLRGVAEVPLLWEKWLAQCLEKDRIARPTSASVVLNLLEEAKRGGEVVSQVPVQDKERMVEAVRAEESSVVVDRANDVGVGETKVALSGVERVAWYRRPWAVAVCVLLLFAGGIQALVLGPNSAKLAHRESLLAGLKQLDGKAEVDPAERLAAWEAFVAAYEHQSIAFNRRGEDQIREAHAQTRFWKKAKEERDEEEARLVKMKMEKALREQKLTLEFGHQLEKMRSSEMDVATEDVVVLEKRMKEWERLMGEFDVVAAPQNDDYKAHLLVARKELSQVKERLGVLREKAEREAAMEGELVAGYEKRIKELEQQCLDETMDLNVKAQLWVDLQRALEGDLKRSMKLEAMHSLVKKKAQEYVLLAQGEFLKKPLGLLDLFKNSPFAGLTELQKRYVLRKAQDKFKEQGLLKSEPDGQHGLPTHQAIIQFQQSRQLPVNAQLDAATLKELELDALTPDMVVLQTKMEKAPLTSEEMAQGPGDEGMDGEGNKAEVAKAGEKKAEASKTASSSGSSGSSSGRSSRRSSREPPKSIYDVQGGKMRELMHRARGTIDKKEWEKHQRYLRYWEERGQ